MRQKSRELWLKDGDTNTRFFHLSTVIRRKFNAILSIKNDSNEWINDEEGINNYFIQSFQALFCSTNPDMPENLENLICPMINQEENDHLTKIPTIEDIESIIREMGSLKSPGPDGMPALFYKKFWHIIKEDFTKAIQNFFRTGYLLPEWNTTFISLIPKKQNANNFSDFRPISLTNTCYKVISKLLANKLKTVSPKLISPNQTAFLEGRWINENSVLAQEIVHTMNKSKSKKGWVGLKIKLLMSQP